MESGSLDPEREWVYRHVQPSDFEIERGPIGLRQSRKRSRGMMRGWFKNGFGGEQNTTKQNMTTIEKLERIKTKCEQLLAIAEKRTPGKWKNTKGKHGTIIRRATEKVGEPQDVCRMWNCSRLEGNAAFVADCAGPAEAGWRATIAAVDSLADMGEHDAEMLGANILAAWPEELL